MLKTYKYRLYPTEHQKVSINTTINLCRYLYNCALEHRTASYKNYKLSVSKYSQSSELVSIKEYLPDYKNVYSQVLQDVLSRLDKAFRGFFRRVRTAETPGYPRYQSRDRYNSFTYPQSGFVLKGNKLVLSKIGAVKIRQHRPIDGNIKTCTIVRKNFKYYVCFSAEVEPKIVPSRGTSVGLDMGLTHFCTTSEGEYFDNHRNYRKSEQKLKEAQRKLTTKKRASNRRAKAKRMLANIHEKIVHQRTDQAHKLANFLIDKYDTIVIEDLNIINMLKGNLTKSITDAGWGTFFNILESKAKQTLGKTVIKVNPAYTSQTCSNCGRTAKKSLAERVHSCSCGLTIDRDLNAAINILNLGSGRALGFTS